MNQMPPSSSYNLPSATTSASGGFPGCAALLRHLVPKPCSPSLAKVSLLCFLLLALPALFALHTLQIKPVGLLSNSKLVGLFQGQSWNTDPLAKILEDAAMPDKTVIFTSVNAAWAEPNSLLDLFLESFRQLNSTENLLNHLVIVAFDQKAYDRCTKLHRYCYQLQTEGVDFSGVKAYMSTDYVKMMWRRIEFLLTILQRRYSFIFSDADILWFRDPFPHLLPNKDFQISCDRFNGNSSSFKNPPNGGYSFAQSNEKSIQFYKYWYESRLKYPTKHDQDVFIEIRNGAHMEEIGVRVGYLDNKFFASFCSHRTFNMSFSSTIHSNCCNGRDNKV